MVNVEANAERFAKTQTGRYSRKASAVTRHPEATTKISPGALAICEHAPSKFASGETVPVRHLDEIDAACRILRIKFQEEKTAERNAASTQYAQHAPPGNAGNPSRGPTSYSWRPAPPTWKSRLKPIAVVSTMATILALCTKMRYGNATMTCHDAFLMASSLILMAVSAAMLHLESVDMCQNRAPTFLCAPDGVIICCLNVVLMAIFIGTALTSSGEQTNTGTGVTPVHGSENAATRGIIRTPILDVPIPIVLIAMIASAIMARTTLGHMLGTVIVEGNTNESASDNSTWKKGTRMQIGMASVLLVLRTIIIIAFVLQIETSMNELQRKGPGHRNDSNTKVVWFPVFQSASKGTVTQTIEYLIEVLLLKDYARDGIDFNLDMKLDSICMISYEIKTQYDVSDATKKKLNEFVAHCKTQKRKGFESVPKEEANAMYYMCMWPAFILELAAYVVLRTEFGQPQTDLRVVGKLVYCVMLPLLIMFAYIQCYEVEDWVLCNIPLKSIVLVLYMLAWMLHKCYKGASGTLESQRNIVCDNGSSVTQNVKATVDCIHEETGSWVKFFGEWLGILDQITDILKKWAGIVKDLSNLWKPILCVCVVCGAYMCYSAYSDAKRSACAQLPQYFFQKFGCTPQ
jgi:hypothetical protein